MSKFLYMGVGVAFEEKRAWIMVVVTVAAYGTYLAIVFGRASGIPLTDAAYVAPLLWTVGAAIVAAIVLQIVVATVAPRDANQKDQRDREIARFGDHVGQAFVIVGAVAALILAMAQLPYFWIANAIYLAFVLSALLGSAAKISAYRWGFQTW
jgi:hypothetical protein